MKNLRLIIVFILSWLATPHGAQYVPDDTLELKTTCPNGSPRTIYKGTWRAKIANLELYDSNGVVTLNLQRYEGTMQELCYFNDTTFSMNFGSDSIDREIDILADSLKAQKVRIDKSLSGAGTLLLWVNGKGAVEHAVWYWYVGLSRLYMRKTMIFAENWKIKPIKSGKGYVVRRNVDFK